MASKRHQEKHIKPNITEISPKPPVCVYRKSDNAEARILTITGENLEPATLQFRDVVSHAESIHFGMEVEWVSSTEIRVDVGRIHHKLWPNTKLSLQVRLCANGNLHPISGWSPTFTLADDEKACASAVFTSVHLHAHPRVVCAAIEILGNLEEVRALDTLIELLNATDDSVRATAATALGKFKDRRVVEPLATVLGDPHYLVRQAASKALTQVGYQFKDEVFKALIEVLNTEV